MTYKELSNAIQIAAATGNTAELYELNDQIEDSLTAGDISVLDRAALQGELEAEVDALQRDDISGLRYGEIEQGL